jgi:predicted dehydrogenase
MIKNVAVVGCGIGRTHIVSYAAHPDKFRVVAICDLNDERLASIGDEFGIERRTKDYAEILRMDDVDIVDVCTPPAVHLEQILAALAAGKNVVCEKPLVGSVADVDKVIEAEKQSRGRVLPIFQYRYGNGIMKAKHIIDQGIAGKPYLASVEVFWKRTAKYYDNPWRGRWDTELGGVLVTHAIHLHDLLTFIMGPVKSVFARAATRVNDIEVEDCVVGSLEMQSGALASTAATLGSQDEISRLRFSFENVTFESCQKPYAPGDDPWKIIPASPEVQARIDQAFEGWNFVPTRFEGLFAPYHEALVSGGELPITLADARRSLELLTAFYQSIETERPQTLQVGPDHPRYANWSLANKGADILRYAARA